MFSTNRGITLQINKEIVGKRILGKPHENTKEYAMVHLSLHTDNCHHGVSIKGTSAPFPSEPDLD